MNKDKRINLIIVNLNNNEGNIAYSFFEKTLKEKNKSKPNYKYHTFNRLLIDFNSTTKEIFYNSTSRDLYWTLNKRSRHSMRLYELSV